MTIKYHVTLKTIPSANLDNKWRSAPIGQEFPFLEAIPTMVLRRQRWYGSHDERNNEKKSQVGVF